MATFPVFDLNIRLEEDDDDNLPLDLNEHEDDAGFDLNEPVPDEHGNGTTSCSFVHVNTIFCCMYYNMFFFL